MEDKSLREAEKLVNSILKGKNIKASKTLEKIIQQKCADKIKNTLDN